MQAMSKTHRIAGLKISRIAPRSAPSRELLPELEPPEDRLRRAKSAIFGSDTIELSHNSAIEDVFGPNFRDEHRDVVARITVYVLNLIVMVFALPLGLALLCLNILGGENLRTTAHILALTGLFMALATDESRSLTLWFM